MRRFTRPGTPSPSLLQPSKKRESPNMPIGVSCSFKGAAFIIWRLDRAIHIKEMQPPFRLQRLQ